MPMVVLALCLVSACLWGADASDEPPAPEPPTLEQQQLDHLLATEQFAAAEQLLRARLAYDEDDVLAKRGLVRLGIARREAEIRDLVAEQAELYDEVLGHPAYEREKALTSGVPRARLDMIEYLVAQQRYQEALRLTNG
ncbi:MAG: hypothetical protein ACOCXA_05970, partial [Planctomycetota bacterium]